MNDESLQRARRWYDGLPYDDRPAWEDVEVVVRLHVTSPAVSQRLLLRDPESFARHFDSLRPVLLGLEPVLPAPIMMPPDEPPIPTEPPGDVRPVTQNQQQARVLAWLEDLRQEGFRVEASTEVVEQVLRATTPAQLRGLLPRDLLRRRGEELAALLALGREEPEEVRPAGKHLGEEPAFEAAPTTGFAPFSNWGSVPEEVVQFSGSAAEGIGLAWEAPAGQTRVRIYRVTARDDYEPASPDESRLVSSTYDTHATDTGVFTTAKRHFAVWLNEGRDERHAMSAQPQLWATGTCVLPVRDVRLTLVDGQVAGTWNVADGVDRVEVHRLPESEARTDKYNQRYLIGRDEPGANLLGFEDHAEPGRWVYRIYACALHNGRSLRSPLVEERVTVEAVLPRVTDLEVASDPSDPDLCTLSWTRPSLADASVEIHRHRQPLQAGIEARVLDRGAMARYGLGEETRVNQPAVEMSGRMVMERVRWPADAPRIHLTAVTRSWDGEQFQIGNSVTRNRAGEVTHATLIERVDEQFLTFGWPEGADFVQVFQGAPNVDVEDVTSLACLAQMSREKYERLGGAHLEHRLPATGCRLHVVGVSYHEGRPSQGPVTSLEYAGLTRIEYRLERPTAEPVRRGIFGRKAAPPAPSSPARLSVRADRDVESVHLALVHYRTRLPLHPDEGERILEGPVSLRAGQPLVLKEQLHELAGRGGFVRLFAILPEEDLERIAVLDPPIDQLRCD